MIPESIIFTAFHVIVNIGAQLHGLLPDFQIFKSHIFYSLVPNYLFLEPISSFPGPALLKIKSPQPKSHWSASVSDAFSFTPAPESSISANSSNVQPGNIAGTSDALNIL